MIPNHADFSDMLSRWARERPDGLAVSFGDTRRTWAHLVERVQRIAGGNGYMKEFPYERFVRDARILPIFEGKPIPRKQPLYWQYDRALGWATVAMRDGNWKILADANLKRFELYDVQRDIGEKTDVAAQHPDVVKQLLALADEARAEIGDYDRIGAEARFFDAGPPRPDMNDWKRTQAR